MFNFFGKKQDGESVALEKQMQHQRDITKEQAILSGATNPYDDVTYLEQRREKSDLLRWQQELDEDLFNLILSFRSLQMLDGKPIPIIENDKPVLPLCNHLFIVQIVTPLLKPFMSKNIINSNFDTPTILQMQKDTFNDLADVMADNWDKYAITFENFDKIIRDMKNIVKASIYRAYQGFTKKTDSSNIKVLHSKNENPQQEEQKRFLGVFPK